MQAVIIIVMLYAGCFSYVASQSASVHALTDQLPG